MKTLFAIVGTLAIVSGSILYVRHHISQVEAQMKMEQEAYLKELEDKNCRVLFLTQDFFQNTENMAKSKGMDFELERWNIARQDESLSCDSIRAVWMDFQTRVIFR